MKSVHKLTLEKNDIVEAIRYWIENYHGLAFDSSTNDSIHLHRLPTPITVTLNDEL